MEHCHSASIIHAIMYISSKPLIYITYLQIRRSNATAVCPACHICRSNATAIRRVMYVHVEKRISSHLMYRESPIPSQTILRFEMNRVPPVYHASDFLPSRASSKRLAKF